MIFPPKFAIKFVPEVNNKNYKDQEKSNLKNACTPMFIAALFIIAKTWKHPKCPSADEWIKRIWYTYTMEYYSAIKRNKTGSFVVTWMDLKGHKA